MSNSTRLESLGFKPSVVASTSVKNLEESIKWYSEKLGFDKVKLLQMDEMLFSLQTTHALFGTIFI